MYVVFHYVTKHIEGWLKGLYYYYFTSVCPVPKAQVCVCQGGEANFLLIFPPTYRSTTYLPTFQPTYLPTYLPSDLPTYLLTDLPTYRSTTYLPTDLPTYLPTYLPTHLPTSSKSRSGSHLAFQYENRTGAHILRRVRFSRDFLKKSKY
jgi:hypothetical protein